jgi:hypothetical protein
MKLLLIAIAIGYDILGIYTRAEEAAGVRKCDCYPDCWCRRPGVSVFRWVFPWFHHNPSRDAWNVLHPANAA